MSVCRETRHKYDTGFVVLWYGCSYLVFVAQWLTQQHPTTKAPVRVQGAEHTHTDSYDIVNLL